MNEFSRVVCREDGDDPLNESTLPLFVDFGYAIYMNLYSREPIEESYDEMDEEDEVAGVMVLKTNDA